MACCLTASNHYLNQCWLIISKARSYSSEGNSTTDTPAINHKHRIEIRGLCVRQIQELLNGAALQWRHNGRDGISYHQHHHCLLNCLFRRRSKKTSELRVTGLCVGNSPVTGEFLARMASHAENVSIWWRHHVHRWFSGLFLKDVEVPECRDLVRPCR